MGIENTIGQEVVDAAVQLHRELGPGLLESVYEATLAEEVKQRGYRAEKGLDAVDGIPER
ncbi:MAG: hypothetical protein BRD57_00200 [Proteobacteria bacterium SW_6_67_9]|nr:MAG: hypothetical protein BRD57_00200 [Proteobacteria bacterium SW_6_67_9]